MTSKYVLIIIADSYNLQTLDDRSIEVQTLDNRSIFLRSNSIIIKSAVATNWQGQMIKLKFTYKFLPVLSSFAHHILKILIFIGKKKHMKFLRINLNIIDIWQVFYLGNETFFYSVDIMKLLKDFVRLNIAIDFKRKKNF